MVTSEIEKHLYFLEHERPDHHDLWHGDKINCSSNKLQKMSFLKTKGLESFSSNDLDFIIFASDYTVGTCKTFQFFLPSFFRVYFEFRDTGIVTDAQHVFEKLDYCKFQDWSEPAQLAALNLCLLAAQTEQAEHVDCFKYDDAEISGLIKEIENKIATY